MFNLQLNRRVDANKILIKMRVLIYILCICQFFLASCVRPKYPDAPIEHPKMVLITKDLMQASILPTTTSKSNKPDSVRKNLYIQVFKQYNVSQEDFMKSYQMYAENPQWLDTLYFHVGEALSEEQAKVK